MNMSVEKALTKEIAEQFVANQEAKLSVYTTISDDAAEILSAFSGTLSLHSLKKLSDSVAITLARHTGTLEIEFYPEFDDSGNIINVLQLSVSAAESLAKHKKLVTDHKKISNLKGETFYFGIKNYRRVSSTNNGEVMTVNEGGVFADEAVFLFDGIETKISCTEDESGRRTLIEGVDLDHFNDTENQFLKLFSKVLYNAYMDGLCDGPVDLENDWDSYLPKGEFEKIVGAYPEFLKRHNDGGISQPNSDDPISALNQELEIALNKKEKHKSGESKQSSDEFRALLKQIVDLKHEIGRL
jgi:hypothetical protein